MREMSAKDKAFERERQRLQSRIHTLKETIGGKNVELAGFRAALQERDARIQELEQQVQTLSQALSREDLKLLLEREKRQKELADNLSTLLHFSQML